MLTILERLVGVLRRGDVLLPAVDRRAPDGGLSLRELGASVPGLRDELVDRARAAGLLVGWVAVVAVPAWTVVDRLTVPELAGPFLVVRLAGDIPMLLAMFALWRMPVGRRRPELLTDDQLYRAKITRNTVGAPQGPWALRHADRAPRGRARRGASNAGAVLAPALGD